MKIQEWGKKDNQPPRLPPKYILLLTTRSRSNKDYAIVLEYSLIFQTASIATLRFFILHGWLCNCHFTLRTNKRDSCNKFCCSKWANCNVYERSYAQELAVKVCVSFFHLGLLKCIRILNQAYVTCFLCLGRFGVVNTSIPASGRKTNLNPAPWSIPMEAW